MTLDAKNRAGVRNPSLRASAHRGKLMALISLLIVLSPLSVGAESLDHACLKACVASGVAKSACMGQCRYLEAESPPKRAGEAKKLSPHRVFEAPVPMREGEVAERPAPASAGLDKNLVCARGCMAQGNSSGFCRAQCAKDSCPPGSVLCASQGGATATR